MTSLNITLLTTIHILYIVHFVVHVIRRYSVVHVGNALVVHKMALAFCVEKLLCSYHLLFMKLFLTYMHIKKVMWLKTVISLVGQILYLGSQKFSPYWPLLHWRKFIPPNIYTIQDSCWSWQNFCPVKIFGYVVTPFTWPFFNFFIGVAYPQD